MLGEMRTSPVARGLFPVQVSKLHEPPRMNTWVESLSGTFIRQGRTFTLRAEREEFSLQSSRACPTWADAANSGLAAGEDTGLDLRNQLF